MVRDPLWSTLKSILNASKFQAFLEGVHVDISAGEKLFLKVESVQRITELATPFEFYFRTQINCDGQLHVGYGTGDIKLLALQKSVSESVERAIFKHTKERNGGPTNTNGWAAHVSVDQAKRNAIEELLERDAVLVHWLIQRSMKIITSETYPTWLSRFLEKMLPTQPRFNAAQMLISDLGYIPTVTVLLLDADGHAVVSHATHELLDIAIAKALTETTRIAKIASTNKFIHSSSALIHHSHSKESTLGIYPEDHAMVYAHHLRFPKWIAGEMINWRHAQKTWMQKHKEFLKNPIDFEFHQVATSPLVVGYCTSPKVQNLFFGPTNLAHDEGLINIDRILSAGGGGEINQLPHFIA
jgi:hypothetical protein